MTNSTTTPVHNGAGKTHSTDLLKGSIKFLTIVLMVTAAAAPLVVASTYIPLSIGYGSGIATPITYAIATIILLIFSIGFGEMAKRITSTGAFYTFTTQGLGKPTGLGAGYTILASYSMIAAAIQGGFGYFASAFLQSYLGVAVPWWVCSIVSLVLMFAISYFKVTVTARVLGVLLILEVIVVIIVVISVIAQGGAEGQMASTFDPAQFALAPAIGLGFFFAFWSWIGFETTAIYGEETADPRKSVPRATYIAVITLGIFYTITSYAAVIGFGKGAPGEAVDNLGGYFFALADMYSVPAVRVAMDILVVTGFFACSFAFHNNASRYLYSLGRDGLLPRVLGRTHHEHKSPAIAAGVQAAIAIVVVALFALANTNPLLELGTWVPIFCTLGVVFVQLLVSLAVVGYFNKVGRKGAAAYWKTMVAPIVGAVAQGVIALLLISNLSFLAGSEALVVTLIPVYVIAIALIGVVYALWLKRRDPARYQSIGVLRDEESGEVIPSV
jgi:amino acid transporter